MRKPAAARGSFARSGMLALIQNKAILPVSERLLNAIKQRHGLRVRAVKLAVGFNNLVRSAPPAYPARKYASDETDAVGLKYAEGDIYILDRVPGLSKSFQPPPSANCWLRNFALHVNVC